MFEPGQAGYSTGAGVGCCPAARGLAVIDGFLSDTGINAPRAANRSANRLEIGAGSGYAAAVLSEIAADVYTVERLGQLAEQAAARLADLGYDNVHVLHGDGTRGWPEHAPYDAIVVAAGGAQVPESLKEQLKIGGQMVIPVGADQRAQELVRVTRISKDRFRSEDIADVRFVPLIGEEGWAAHGTEPARQAPGAAGRFPWRGSAGPQSCRRRRIVSVD